MARRRVPQRLRSSPTARGQRRRRRRVAHAAVPAVVVAQAAAVVGRQAPLGDPERDGRRRAAGRRLRRQPLQARLELRARPIGVNGPAGDAGREVGHGGEHAVDPVGAAGVGVICLHEETDVHRRRGDRLVGGLHTQRVGPRALDVRGLVPVVPVLIAVRGLVAELDLADCQVAIGPACPEAAAGAELACPAGQRAGLRVGRHAAVEAGQGQDARAVGGVGGDRRAQVGGRSADRELDAHVLGAELGGGPRLIDDVRAGDDADLERRVRRESGSRRRRRRRWRRGQDARGQAVGGRHASDPAHSALGQPAAALRDLAASRLGADVLGLRAEVFHGGDGGSARRQREQREDRGDDEDVRSAHGPIIGSSPRGLMGRSPRRASRWVTRPGERRPPGRRPAATAPRCRTPRTRTARRARRP